MPRSEMPKSEHAREARNFRGCRSHKESSWTNPLQLKCCPDIAATCCQHGVSIGEAAPEKETPHETCRPAVPDHSGASAHPETTDSRCDCGRVGDLEADDLPLHRDPDRTAR